MPDEDPGGLAARPSAFGTPTAGGVARRRWLLISAILVTPISMHGAAALFLIYLVAVAVSTPWPTLPRYRLLYLAAWVAAAALWLVAGTTGDAGWHHPLAPRHRHPVSLLDYLLMLFGFALMAIDRYSARDLKAVLTALVATVPVHFLFAVGQRYLGWGVVWATVPIGHGRLLELNLRIPELLAGRISAGLVHPNRLAAYSLICCVAASALLANEWRVHRTIDMRWGRRLRCAALFTIIAFCLVMLAWSGSRGAWLATIVLALPGARLVGIRWRHVAGAIVGAVVSVVLAVADLGAATRIARRLVPEVVWGRLSSSPPPGLRVSPPDWRLSVYRCTWDLSGERPLTGWGVGGWVEECEARLDIVMNHAHNIFLQVAAESGRVAMIVFVASLVWVLGKSLRQADLLPEPTARRLYGGLVLMAAALLLTNQTSMVLMHAARLQIVFAFALAAPYSLVFHRSVRR